MDEGLLSRAKQVAEQGPETIPEPVQHPMRIPSTRLQRLVRKADSDFERFCMGDSVLLLPDKKNAIVYRPADDDGNVIIQLQGQKLSVRLCLRQREVPRCAWDR